MSSRHRTEVKPTHAEVFRFFSKVDASSGVCWEWLGATSRGYGVFRRRQPLGTVMAHRMAWLVRHGSVPALPLCLDHLCRNRACVRPDHLEAVTLGENVLRGDSVSARNALKTHCPRGHFYGQREPGTRGSRQCRQCNIDALRALRKRNSLTRQGDTHVSA